MRSARPRSFSEPWAPKNSAKARLVWESLPSSARSEAAVLSVSPDQIREQNLYPKGFYPLPHPKHQEGGFVFPHFVIDAITQPR